MSRRTPEQRFWAKVNKTETCWLWTRATDHTGYGLFQSGGRQLRAHRIAYELLVGPIPEGMVIDHKCHTRSCVNPAHLRPVTQKQNMENRRSVNSNSASGIRGVTWDKRAKKWRVVVCSDGVFHHGGQFKDIKDAEAAAIALRNKLFTHNDADRHAAPLEVAA